MDHVPVMPREALQYLEPRGGGIWVDFTVGGGGHARLIAERLPADAVLVGFDRDPAALAAAAERLRDVSPPVVLIHAGFERAAPELARRGFEKIAGAIADLGVSSMQLDRPERGFSFAAEGPLDMRMDPTQDLTAEQVVNETGERELADLIYQFGEERRSRRIARAIVRSRPLHTTADLARVVAAASRPMSRDKRRMRSAIHPATRTFQALRIFVNSEIEALDRWLAQLPQLLNPGARAVVISFHSLEDRAVKQAFREAARRGEFEILTPHVVRPGEDEMRSNPRSRSAKLRAAERLA
jgi:16S rRNA (cytosine1402-N4)-methyltransferase